MSQESQRRRERFTGPRTLRLVVLAAFLATSLAPGTSAGSIPADPVLLGLITYPGGPPGDAEIQALLEAGIEAQELQELPFAIVRGPSSRIRAFTAGNEALAFHPDEKITFTSDESNRAIGVSQLHKLGLTGKGIQVAVVDTGIDATHPDLADHVVHNVRLVGTEYANRPGTPPGPIIIPMDEGPYSNTDQGLGHGTMVAGIIGADGTTDPEQVGVAPDADLIGYGASGPNTGIVMALAAYDHILAHPDWGIDVVNNSFGGSWKPWDPSLPMHIATKALTDAGIVMVFVAGNNGYEDDEIGLSTYGISPWTISAAGSNVDGKRWEGSSSGITWDNFPVGAFRDHQRAVGNRIGFYRPTVAAPAEEITTSCTPVNRWDVCPTPGGTATTSGTSFAAPHISGLAALLRQARPSLSVRDLRRTLEATAVPTKDEDPYWQVGYGIVDAPAALSLATSKHFKARLAKTHASATKRVLGRLDWRVSVADLWIWKNPEFTAPGTETRTFSVKVPKGTDALKALVFYGVYYGQSEFSFVIRDADGAEVVRSSRQPVTLPAYATAFVDLRGKSPAYGTWEVEVRSGAGLKLDPILEHPDSELMLALHVALLKEK